MNAVESVFLIVGTVLLARGCHLIYPPLAYIVLGLLFIKASIPSPKGGE